MGPIILYGTIRWDCPGLGQCILAFPLCVLLIFINLFRDFMYEIESDLKNGLNLIILLIYIGCVILLRMVRWDFFIAIF